MKRLFVLFLFVFAVLMVAGQALAFETELIPRRVKQGDPFLVKVRAAELEPEITFQELELTFSSCGEGCYVAMGAVDLGTEPGTYKVSVLMGEEARTLWLEVTEGVFPVQRITVDEEKVVLSPEDEARANREAEKLRALWPQTTERLWTGGFGMPLRNSFSTFFGTKRIFNDIKESVHTGLDIRGRPGEEIWAANRGRVIIAEDMFYGGNTVVLDHGQGIYTIYMHMSEFKVELDQVVEKGQVVGLVGSTGRATGPHLHFGVKVAGINANPEAVTKLPLFGL